MYNFLQSTSGWLFIVSFIFARCRSIPNQIARAVFDTATLITSFSAYLAWFLASIISPVKIQKPKAWYGFGSFAFQNVLAAAFGMLSIITFALSLAFPPLFVAGSWFIAASNILWLCGELQRFNHLSKEGNESSTDKQKTYLNYVIFMLAASVTTAILGSFALAFPAASAIILLVSSMAAIFFTLNAGQYWLAQNAMKVENAKVTEVEQPGEGNSLKQLSRLGNEAAPAVPPGQAVSLAPVVESRKSDALQDEIGYDAAEQPLTLK